jgi:hypothetical protein
MDSDSIFLFRIAGRFLQGIGEAGSSGDYDSFSVQKPAVERNMEMISVSAILVGKHSPLYYFFPS